jgi:hypothetical protein
MKVSQQVTPKVVEAFLVRYKSLKSGLARHRSGKFKVEFAQLRRRLTPVQRRVRERKRRKANQFNIFRLLGVERDEVKTHSALIADLLNPRGTHGQGAVFLEIFLALCAKKSNGFPKPPRGVASVRWDVYTEKRTRFGRPDIVVASPELKTLIVIENKIYAGDQDRQLHRYAEWMASLRTYAKGTRLLIYLTPEGRRPELTDEDRYCLFSYRDDITSWIQTARAQVRAVRVRECLDQYLRTVKSL